MKILIAPDSFKEACTALEATNAIALAALQVFGDKVELVKIPMADGGEGTVRSLVDAAQGQIIEKQVRGPLGDPVLACYGLLDHGQSAVIEMAEASGLHLVPRDKRNPMITSTYGTGQLIADALDRGVSSIILGIGGSATNDGGTGMARALGYRFLDAHGQELPDGGGALNQLAKIDTSHVHLKLHTCDIKVACDVTNPLCGIYGSSRVFGPQKGGDAAMVEILDQNLHHYSQIVAEQLGKNILDIPGAGAAGGLGAGLLAFTNAHLRPGVDIVLDYTNLKARAQDVTICITGEGQIDFQTKFGKTPYGVMKAVKEVSPDARVIAIAGCLGDHIEELYKVGFDGIFSITPGPDQLENLIRDTEKNITRTCEGIFRSIR